MLENVDWFSFVVGGIIISFIINVSAGLVQPKIRNILSRFSEERRNKNQKLKELFEEEVNRLVENSHEEVIARSKANARLMSSIQFNILLLSIVVVWLVFGAKYSIMISFPILFTLFVFNVLRDYPSEIHNILGEVDKRKGRRTKDLKDYIA